MRWALRTLIFVHRWLGVGLSVIFLLWFGSGIVMMYWSYPEIGPQDRLERAPTLTADTIRISPEEALAVLGVDEPPAQMRIASFDGRPVYRVTTGGGRGGRGRRGGNSTAIVYADAGTEHRVVDAPMMDRAAAQWAGRPIRDAQKTAVEAVDQWTVGSLRNLRPLYKYSWPDGQQVYVDGRSGEVVQYTTSASRFWAYVGAIPHWLYFTPLRKHQNEWSSIVVWSSLIGTCATLIGMAIAIWMYSPRKRYRRAGQPTSIPYRGWKRWHTIAGLCFGVVTTTWAFSGLLSMGPFPIMNRLTDLTVPAEPGDRPDAPRLDLAAALRGRGLELSAYAAKHPRTAIAQLAGFEVKEIEYSSFDGRPFYLATNGRGDTRVVPIDGDPMRAFDSAEVMRIARQAAAGRVAELRVMDQYDAYYLDRRRTRPLPVIHLRLDDAIGSRYYIDPRTARVVGTYSARNWVSRWLYHGLHSLDFPWLYNYRPAWDIVVMALMLGGSAICFTSIVLTWRVLARRVGAILNRRVNLPDEDLVAEKG